MLLQKGDWVRTEKGEEGKIVLLSRESAYVEIHAEGENPVVVSHLLADLSKIIPHASDLN